MKKVIICGLGAVGLTFGVKLNNAKGIDLSVIVDKERLNRYILKKPMLNNIEQNFKYILHDHDGLKADLIMISTKFQGLKIAIQYIKNFVGDNTRIISLINGISSENIIASAYPNAKVLKSYFIGHSAVRVDNNVMQDGVGKIVIEKDLVAEEIFNEAGIEYEIPEDINYSMWLKYTFNVFSNQISAISKMTFGEMKLNKEFLNLAKKIINEVRLIAQKEGIKNLENLEKDAINSLSLMSNDGKTSMLQDILAKRKTEVDIFAGEIIRLGQKYGIATPYNNVLYDLIKIEEERT